MTRPRGEGGMGITDFELHQSASVDMRTAQLWENCGIWASWVNQRYVKGNPISCISKKYNDSGNWRQTVDTVRAPGAAEPWAKGIWSATVASISHYGQTI